VALHRLSSTNRSAPADDRVAVSLLSLCRKASQMSEWKDCRKQIEIMIANGERAALSMDIGRGARSTSSKWAHALRFFLADYDRIDKLVRELLDAKTTPTISIAIAEVEELRERARRCACNAFAKTAVERGAPFDEAIHCKTCRGLGMRAGVDVCPDCKGDGSR
jgi:hypothetical protein